MARALQMIDEVLEKGSLSEKEHDNIMRLIHKDGKIDSDESEKLSLLFNAIKSGKVVFKEDSKSASKESNDHKMLKEDALRRDLDREKELSFNSELNERNDFKGTEKVNLYSNNSQLELVNESSSEADDKSTNDYSHLFGLKEYQIKPREEQFHKVTERMLEAQLNGRIWMKTGAMVAYQGAIKFRREGITEHGVGKLLKRGVTGESTPLSAAEGSGTLFLADNGKKIELVELKGVPLYIQSQHILAFEDSVKWDIQPLFNIGTALAGGLFHICFNGRGKVAFTSEFDPIVLRVRPGNSIMTDAAATVGWSSGVVPSVKTDINIQTLIGRTSGETLQLRFEGDGIVIIQAFESKIS